MTNPIIVSECEKFEEISNYTNEYGYVHKIPNYEKIKLFLTSSLERAIAEREKETKIQVCREIQILKTREDVEQYCRINLLNTK